MALLSSASVAGADPGAAYDALDFGIKLVEFLVPEMHLELKPSEDAALSAVAAFGLNFHLHRPDGPPTESLMVEPQFRLGHGDFRVLGGLRSRRWTRPLVLEGGGVVGTDGFGPFVGAGWNIEEGDDEQLTALIMRGAWTDQGVRVDIFVDVVYF